MTPGQLRQYARLMTERYQGRNSSDAKAARAQAELIEAEAELIEAEAGIK